MRASLESLSYPSFTYTCMRGCFLPSLHPSSSLSSSSSSSVYVYVCTCFCVFLLSWFPFLYSSRSVSLPPSLSKPHARDQTISLSSNVGRKVGRRGLGARLVRSPCLPRNWGKMKLTEQSDPPSPVPPFAKQSRWWTLRLAWPIAVGPVQRTRTGSLYPLSRPHYPNSSPIPV